MFFFFLYANAAGHTRQIVARTFIMQPIGPVVLNVTISTRQITTDIISPDSGPKMYAPIRIIALLNSRSRYGAAGIIGILHTNTTT